MQNQNRYCADFWPAGQHRNLDRVIDQLNSPASSQEIFTRPAHCQPMPSVSVLTEIMDLIKAVIFPGYFRDSEVYPNTMSYYLGTYVDRIYRLLGEQIMRGYCFLCKQKGQEECSDCEDLALHLSGSFISTLPRIRSFLATDVRAAFAGDPAAKSPGEVIFCYPSILALIHYRVARELHRLDVDLLPRIISELAHSRTGIDIHPGAEIGRYFFIDHGTGAVIGETCIIGENVRLYQGVTLGGKSIKQDDTGMAIKGVPRHPIVEDNVVIYSGATILGRVRIGQDSTIGGNVWITEDVAPGSKVVQKRNNGLNFADGAGI